MPLFTATDALADYVPRRPAFFEPARIVLTRGSERPEYAQRVAAICAAYPDAEVIDNRGLPHNRVDLGTSDLTAAHYRGKQTLVLAVHRSAVRLSSEEGNTCPNYWHFSPYGFCPFDCSYCYLAGTPGVRFSPTVKVYLNLEEILGGIDQAARKLATPTPFYLGKLQDGMAVDPLTGYSRVLVPFFANHPYARMTLLRKSAEIDNLLELDHRKHTILSWSVNPPEVVAGFEPRTPAVSDRLNAMSACARVGYPVRAVLMPVVPIEEWQQHYACFLEQLLKSVPLQRITIGGICSYSSAKALMEHKLGRANAISRNMGNPALLSGQPTGDGRLRYPVTLRIRMYRFLMDVIRRHAPASEVSLCLEDPDVFAALDLEPQRGRCNCVL